jgi:hypothetical protein
MEANIQQEFTKRNILDNFTTNHKFEVFFVVSYVFYLPGLFSGNVETVTTRGGDYADRENIHQTSSVSTENVINEWDESHPYGNVVYA